MRKTDDIKKRLPSEPADEGEPEKELPVPSPEGEPEKELPATSSEGEPEKEISAASSEGEPSEQRHTHPLLLLWKEKGRGKRMILARYLLPVAMGVLFLALSFGHTVMGEQGSSRIWVSDFQLLLNSFKSIHVYLGDVHTTAQNGFYGLLAAGAVAAILFFLAAAFFNGFALYTAFRAFSCKGEDATCKRMKIWYKIVFPNRVFYFIANCLYLPAALFPHFIARLSRKFPSVGGIPIRITLNIPLLLLLLLTLAAAVLAFLSVKHEKTERMEMTVIYK